MEPNLAPLAPTPRPLPPVAEYLRDVVSLGLRSLLPAISALLLLCFYRFGMGLYLEFAVQQTSPLGFPDQRAQAAHLILTAAAYLPLLVLIYTPFLPLQDAILRGGRKSFLDSMRHVLECMVPFGFSSVAQIVILAVPLFGMFAIAAAALSTVPGAPKEVIAGTIVLLLLPACAWVAIAGLFMLFATPALVLDGLGPIQSIRFSAREVARRFWGIFGRLIAGFTMIFAIVVFASFPASILAMTAAVSGFDSTPLKIARVLWTSIVTAVAFPFTVAVLMTIYRAVAPVVPAASDAPAAPPLADGPPVAEPRTPETPYIFE